MSFLYNKLTTYYGGSNLQFEPAYFARVKTNEPNIIKGANLCARARCRQEKTPATTLLDFGKKVVFFNMLSKPDTPYEFFLNQPFRALRDIQGRTDIRPFTFCINIKGAHNLLIDRRKTICGNNLVF